eukprot:TRINITY_DN7156_c0_g2_i1.p1 TRINITY_DN7156_c0_g2~~TRINITY_DN7156_c0_g2_i1.p1  ORF type:complete len:309 (+),score=-65.18 TRINITY_DN7156_c0_g2_i1:514-1440(+)
MSSSAPHYPSRSGAEEEPPPRCSPCQNPFFSKSVFRLSCVPRLCSFSSCLPSPPPSHPLLRTTPPALCVCTKRLSAWVRNCYRDTTVLMTGLLFGLLFVCFLYSARRHLHRRTQLSTISSIQCTDSRGQSGSAGISSTHAPLVIREINPFPTKGKQCCQRMLPSLLNSPSKYPPFGPCAAGHAMCQNCKAAVSVPPKAFPFPFVLSGRISVVSVGTIISHIAVSSRQSVAVVLETAVDNESAFAGLQPSADLQHQHEPADALRPPLRESRTGCWTHPTPVLSFKKSRFSRFMRTGNHAVPGGEARTTI